MGRRHHKALPGIPAQREAPRGKSREGAQPAGEGVVQPPRAEMLTEGARRDRATVTGQAEGRPLWCGGANRRHGRIVGQMSFGEGGPHWEGEGRTRRGRCAKGTTALHMTLWAPGSRMQAGMGWPGWSRRGASRPGGHVKRAMERSWPNQGRMDAEGPGKGWWQSQALLGSSHPLEKLRKPPPWKGPPQRPLLRKPSAALPKGAGILSWITKQQLTAHLDLGSDELVAGKALCWRSFVTFLPNYCPV